jgi:hypothetical protein
MEGPEGKVLYSVQYDPFLWDLVLTQYSRAVKALLTSVCFGQARQYVIPGFPNSVTSILLTILTTPIDITVPAKPNCIILSSACSLPFPGPAPPQIGPLMVACTHRTRPSHCRPRTEGRALRLFSVAGCGERVLRPTGQSWPVPQRFGVQCRHAASSHAPSCPAAVEMEDDKAGAGPHPKTAILNICHGRSAISPMCLSTTSTRRGESSGRRSRNQETEKSRQNPCSMTPDYVDHVIHLHAPTPNPQNKHW